MRRFLRRFCCLVLGFVLFLAGVLKLMDPVGASLVVEEYFKFLDMQFMVPVSKSVAVVLAFAEAGLGIALITGVWKRQVAWLSLGFLVFFTMITMMLVVWNPDMDCGCFGEVIHLTHIQSLVKNLILIGLWAGYALPMDKFTPTQHIKYVSFSVSVISVAVFAFYSLLGLPLQDFTEFKTGESLEDVQLSVSDADGMYCDSLLNGDMVAAISIYDPESLSAGEWIRISEFLSDAGAVGYEPVLLTASYPEQLSALVPDPAMMDFCYFADRRTLMTLNRSNGGASFFDDGQIIAKWSLFRLPDFDRLESMYEIPAAETMLRRTSGQRLRLQALLLYVSAVMLLL